MSKSSCSFNLLLLFSLCTIITSNQLVRVPLKQSPRPRHSQDTRSLSSIDISNTVNMKYTGTIQLGVSKQEFNVVLDTGSGTLWVRDLSTEYSNAYSCLLFDGCKQYKDVVFLEYGGGSVTGYRATSSISFGGMNIPEMNMVMATGFDPDPAVNDDGLLGLGLEKFGFNYPTIVEVLRSSGQLEKGMFSIYLGNDRTSFGSRTGELIFGGYDPKYTTEETFQYVDLISSQEWMGSMDSVTLGNDTEIGRARYKVLFDTGCSLLQFPVSMLTNLVKQSNYLGADCIFNTEKDYFTCNCKARDFLPDLIFHFDGFSLNVPASSYVYYSGSDCFLAISTKIRAYNEVILGDVFLAEYYSIYDFENGRIGLAKAVPTPKQRHPIWIIPMIFLTAIVVAIVIYVIYKRRNGSNLTEYNTLNSPTKGMNSIFKNQNNGAKKPQNVFASSSKGITIGGTGSAREYPAYSGNELQRFAEI